MSPAAPTLLRADASLEDLLTAAESLSGGQVIRVPFSSASSSTSLREHLLLCGLECIRIDKTNNFIEGVQPESVGQSVSLSSRPKKEAQFEDDEELIDEAELLSRDGLVVKAPATNGLGCADAPGGGRQPCKGCSCGLADRVAAGEDGKVDTKGAEKSNCGSCALGDAFRCAGCPYLGLPPFKPGEKVALPSSLMTSDI